MEIIKQFSSVSVWLYVSYPYDIYTRSILIANSEVAPSGESVRGDLPLQWFCPNGISLGSHLGPDGDHGSLLSLSQRHCVIECGLRLLAVNTQSRFVLVALTALVIKRQRRVDLGVCPRSLVTPEAHPGRWETLISPWNKAFFGKGQCTGLLFCWCYQLLAS